ncbi:MAG: PilZ domain-containing protein [Deltaproteobacteria bacterium]|nr:MAG: PilZ domain-containing protein [Deltaproteobacteria bacterium]
MTTLKILKNDEFAFERRKLPHFPFCFLTFKDMDEALKMAYEVKDISHSGMQLLLKDGVPNFSTGDNIEGHIHWKGSDLKITGEVQWVNKARLGIKFDEKLKADILEFLSEENILKSIHPMHDDHLGIELPGNLKYWLHADGPVDLFMWGHLDGEWEEFQIILFKSFVEWKDGEGVRTGVVLTKRNLETPLFEQDEFVFQMDGELNNNKLQAVRSLVEKLSDDFLPSHVIDFLKLKLGD